MLIRSEIFISLCFINVYICIIMKELSPQQKSVLRKVTVDVGSIINIGGVLLKCIERPDVRTLHVSEACSGCYFSIENKTCPPSQCSRFGRLDEKNVWFVRYEEVEDSK
jgi:hypothetical protein